MHALQMIALGRKLTTIYAGLCAPICRKYHVNQTCFDVLLFCANNPKHNTARDVCAVRGIKSGIASVAVETLITRGLLIRAPDPADRRCHRLLPTAEAEALIAEGRDMQKTFTDTLRRGMAEEDLEAFRRLTGQVEENMRILTGEKKG